MKYILWISIILFCGCQTDIQVDKEEQRLNNEIKEVDKNIEFYVDWIIYFGEQMKKPLETTLDTRPCFFWDLGKRGRAHMLKFEETSNHSILIGYNNNSSGSISTCCDYLPFSKIQQKRVNNLYKKWYVFGELNELRSKYNNELALQERLGKLIPKEKIK